MNQLENDLKRIRTELDECSRPLFFFDDDQDGLCSFLLLYRRKKAGKGIAVKTQPVLGENFLASVKYYSPDKVFILDVPNVAKGFLQKIVALNIPVIYIDHHEPYKFKESDNVVYFNPHNYNTKDERPTSYWCYQVVNGYKGGENDIWIAMAGCIGDWFFPDFADEFRRKYPDLLDKKIAAVEDALYTSEIGKLSKVFAFVLKGRMKEVITCIKILTRITAPEEILAETTPQGRFIYRTFEKLNDEYLKLIAKTSKKNIRGNMLIFLYTEKAMSFTSELSNELLYRYPDKVIIIGRKKAGEVKCSIRARNIKLPEKVKRALNGVEGYGGGHEHACGCCVKEKDFKKFMGQFKKEVVQ